MKITWDETQKQLEELKTEIREDLHALSIEAEKDVMIDEIDLDKSLLDIPKLHRKWSKKLSDETITLKEMYYMKESVKLERWKYYNGKQTDQYIANHGIMHEKILKTDIDRYLSSDVKLSLVNDLVSIQKEKCDFIERTMKEIGNRGFHIRAIIDWRKFLQGA